MRARGRRSHGVLSALAFNICLFLAPLAAGGAYIIIARDNLYAYEYSQSGAQVIATRVEKLNGEVIQLDFDRQRQWEDLVAMELMSEDPDAARGFLLSVRGMLGPRIASQLHLPANASDAAIEAAALQLLSPSIRARYEETAPLLSERQAPTPPGAGADDPANFTLLAQALLAQPETDSLQFTLTGLRLGLAGDLGPRASLGAAALLEASRRDDYPLGLEAEIGALMAAAAPIEEFRAALAQSSASETDAYVAAAAAFRVAASRERVARARTVLEQIGLMSEASSPGGAVALLTHASGLRDLPKLALVAQAAGDRAAAAGKRLERDGRLIAAARGELTMTRELASAIAIALFSLLGLLAIVGFKGYRAGRAWWGRWRNRDEYTGDLMELGRR
jgi:hypothetical protein